MPITSSRGGWPAGLLGMLALVAGIERSVAKHSEKFTTFHAAAWRESGRSIELAARSRVVAFGDSLLKYGLIPPVAAGRAGRTVANLAVPAGLFPGHDALLRRLFATGATFDAILVDGELLADDPFRNRRIWSEMMSLAECVELARVGRNPDFLASVALAKLLPTFNARDEVCLSITTAFDGHLPPEASALPIIKRNWRRNGSAEVRPDRDDPPGQDPRAAELAAADYRPAHWACHPVNDVFVNRFLDRAQARGVPVVWLLPPYHPGVEERRGKYGHYAKYLDYLKRLIDRYPNVLVIAGRGAEYPAGALFDMTHLSRTGAITYSDAVGGVLRDLLGRADRPRWVPLPKYDAASAKALAAASPVEDLNTSGRELAKVMEGVARRRLDRDRDRGLARNANPAERPVRR